MIDFWAKFSEMSNFWAKKLPKYHFLIKISQKCHFLVKISQKPNKCLNKNLNILKTYKPTTLHISKLHYINSHLTSNSNLLSNTKACNYAWLPKPAPYFCSSAITLEPIPSAVGENASDHPQFINAKRSPKSAERLQAIVALLRQGFPHGLSSSCI
jgi:hypothetical protein